MADMPNKTLSFLWKNSVYSILRDLYPDKSKEQIQEFINKTYNKYYVPVIAKWRNIYTYQEGYDEIEDIFIKLLNEESTISANGSVFLSYKKASSLIYKFINTAAGKRKHFKKLMLEAIEAANKIAARDYDATQYKYKERMNSTYGVMTQRGSVVSNTDAASSITLQARELIAESLWSTEKFVIGNVSFYNSNEMIQYINIILKTPLENPNHLSFISYIPTVQDCLDKFENSMFEMIDKLEFKQSKLYTKMIQRIQNLSQEERIKYYYKDNLSAFLTKNNGFKKIFYEIFSNSTDFLNPYDIPEVYKNNINIIWELCKNFVLSPTLTYKRAYKYENRTRKSVLMSDTDSIMICLNQHIINISNMLDNQFDFSHNMNNRYKIVNILATLCSNLCEETCYRIALSLNIPEQERSRFAMKNEFYFKRMVLRKGVKKNYSTLAGLREGKIIPEADQLMNTGSSFTSSDIVPEVREINEKILRKYILEPEKINPLEVWTEINKAEKYIHDQIQSGDKTFCLRAKYGGMKKGYANPEGNDLFRGVTIWNRLYKEQGFGIGPGETVYKLKTKVKTVEDAKKYIKDPEWLEKILDLVFDYYGRHRLEYKGQDFSSFGLSAICINATEGMEKIPSWLIPLIDTESIIEMHMKPITGLLVSIGLYKTKINSTKSRISTLMNF